MDKPHELRENLIDLLDALTDAQFAAAFEVAEHVVNLKFTYADYMAFMADYQAARSQLESDSSKSPNGL